MKGDTATIRANMDCHAAGVGHLVNIRPFLLALHAALMAPQHVLVGVLGDPFKPRPEAPL